MHDYYTINLCLIQEKQYNKYGFMRTKNDSLRLYKRMHSNLTQKKVRYCMKKDELIQYYGFLTRFAASKCNTQQDAEDLVSEVMLAACAFLYRGGIIEYPKTWLANTLMHKRNSLLRRKYQIPQVVNIDILAEMSDDNSLEETYVNSDEAAQLRHKLIYLAQTTREVLIRYYFNSNSIRDIAKQLGIPEGTVKSRLSAGRSQLKKNYEPRSETYYMNKNQNQLPGHLNISWSGSSGPNNEPISLVENDLIAQNLLINAYEKPLSMTELAEAIAIPTVYIEPIVKKLTDGELMMRTEKDKFYTDFIITRPEDYINLFDAQQKFVREHFDIFWEVMSDVINAINANEYCKKLNPRQLKKLERYGIMRVLQIFVIQETKAKNIGNDPTRKDGGRWTAMGRAFPAGYDSKRYEELFEYAIWGGHRTNGGDCHYHGAKFLQLCEFDTSLWDNPRRFNTCGYDNYFGGIINFLWCVYKDIPMGEGNIKNAIIENIDNLIECTGLITRENGKLLVDIPVMSRIEYDSFRAVIQNAYDKLITNLGNDYGNYIKGNMMPIPPHLKNVSEIHRYAPATEYIVMTAVREAYDRKLHLHDVDYCCPPVVFVYE